MTSDTESQAAINRRHVPATRNGEPAITLRHLEEGVRDGVITSEQLDALLARAASEEAGEPEARRGLNAITVAYWAGAITVLFALGWFLAARWQQLGPRGVFVVSAVYAVVFAGVSRWLVRQRYRTAAAFMTFLVVATVPALAWSVLAMLGLWYERPFVATVERVRTPILEESTRWIPIDIVTIAAALVALRRVRFALLTAPAALGFWYLVLHTAPLIVGPENPGRKEAWIVLVVGTCLIASGGAILARQIRRPEAPPEDYARWPLIIGLLALAMSATELWHRYRDVVPHVTLVAAAISVAVAIRIRRLEFLVAGAVGFVGYLAWLAFDVFRKTLGFPIVLAGFGLSVILLAVWIQRRYPALVKLASTHSGLPTGRG